MKPCFPLIAVLALAVQGCGNPEEDGHIWKEQTDMMDKAGDVEKTLMEANRQQQRNIEDMAR